MQLYAFDGSSLILASLAEKQKDYRCPECANPIRVRSGPHRQTHFYHIKTPISCRLGKKTLTHLNIQRQIQASLPQGEVVLERRFPEIERIADLYWAAQQIVFEVQCSPISAEEAEARCSDYRSIGIEPVWVLHDQRYNRRFCSASEVLLRQGCCYFTDGKGSVYDQLDTLSGGRRIRRGPRLQVDLSAPLIHPVLHFTGDCISCYGISLPERSQQQRSDWRAKVKWIYRSLFYLLLENVK